jgi:hypothetical protein
MDFLIPAYHFSPCGRKMIDKKEKNHAAAG